MLPRIFFRRISPAAYKIARTMSVLRHDAITTKSTITVVGPVYGLLPRFYSQAAFENLPVVDFEYVKRATSKNEVMIIDVREPDEIKEHGKIPESVNIPLGSISSTLELSEQDFQETFKRAKPQNNTEIIFYCMIGKRSAKAQQNALNLGFKNVKNYLGSWTDWAAKTQ